jgi:Cu/Zn superoxide dismutase
MTEYRLPENGTRLVSAQFVLSGDETVEVDEATADEFGLVAVESHDCGDCEESFDSAQGLANHERTHEVNEE